MNSIDQKVKIFVLNEEQIVTIVRPSSDEFKQHNKYFCIYEDAYGWMEYSTLTGEQIKEQWDISKHQLPNIKFK